MQADVFKRYARSIIDHWWLIVIALVVTVGIALVYIETTAARYSAAAEMLVSPVETSNTALVGLPVLHSSGDPTTDVLTAASLITSTPVADAVVNQLHLKESGSALLSDVTATPVGQSSLVSVAATAGSPKRAADIANAFVDQVVATRATALHTAVAAILPGLRAQVAALPPAQRNGPGTLGDQLSQLEQLSRTNDPSLTISAFADPPASPYKPKKKLALLVAIVAGLIIGVGTALGWDALDPRLRREEQLRDVGRLPVIARIPSVRVHPSDRPMLPGDLSFVAAEGYRTLRSIITARASTEPRSILITGAAPSEGKTTSAINLAFALAQGGSQVTLIEADLRRPTMARSLALGPGPGTEDVLVGRVSLDRALVPYAWEGTRLRVLPVRHPGAELAGRLSANAANELIRHAKSVSDYVVIDSPPLTSVMDALPLARLADEIILVTRLGGPRLSRLEEINALLTEQGKRVLGVVLVGKTPRVEPYYAPPASETPPRSKSPALSVEPLASDARPLRTPRRG